MLSVAFLLAEMFKKNASHIMGLESLGNCFKCLSVWNTRRCHQKWAFILSAIIFFFLLACQEHNQRLQSSYATYKKENVINQEENRRLLGENTNLQQELMQMQKEKEQLHSDIVGLLQETGALQTKVQAAKAPWSHNSLRLSRIMCLYRDLDIFFKVALILQVTEQNKMQQSINTQHEFEKTQVH